MRKWMTLFFASALMLMILASARGEMISVTELREQVETRGRWTADYTDRYDRKIHVDIEPIMGQYDAVPIILAENPRQFTEENIKNSIHGEQMKRVVTEESEQEGVQCRDFKLTLFANQFFLIYLYFQSTFVSRPYYTFTPIRMSFVSSGVSIGVKWRM